jgi:hypothetical protein
MPSIQRTVICAGESDESGKAWVARSPKDHERHKPISLTQINPLSTADQ